MNRILNKISASFGQTSLCSYIFFLITLIFLRSVLHHYASSFQWFLVRFIRLSWKSIRALDRKSVPDLSRLPTFDAHQEMCQSRRVNTCTIRATGCNDQFTDSDRSHSNSTDIGTDCAHPSVCAFVCACACFHVYACACTCLHVYDPIDIRHSVDPKGRQPSPSSSNRCKFVSEPLPVSGHFQHSSTACTLWVYTHLYLNH